MTLSKGKARELLDTGIVALWVTGNGMAQEQALQIVAVHDAGCVLEAPIRVKAQRTTASTLLDWID